MHSKMGIWAGARMLGLLYIKLSMGDRRYHWAIFTHVKARNFQTNQSMNNTQMVHSQMKTEHWGVEEDPSLDKEALIKPNFNRGGGGHVCRSKHEIGRRPSEKFTFFVITRSLCDTKCTILFVCGGVVVLIPPRLHVFITSRRDDDEKSETSRRLPSL
jgi:hypothetical protein